MIPLIWTLAALWAIALIASTRRTLHSVPDVGEAPPYTLWLPEGGQPPILCPAPTRLLCRAALPDDVEGPVLVLGLGVEVTPDLPGRLAAAGAPMVSVLPRPVRGSLAALAIERFRRDFAGPPRVVDPKHPAAYADPRCAWLDATDFRLPGEGDEPVLRAARARKAHGLTVDLRDGGDLVRAPATPVGTHRAGLGDLLDDDPLVRTLAGVIPPLLCLAPWLALTTPGARLPAAIAISCGTLARLVTAARDQFGASLAVAGWIIEPLLAVFVWSARRRRPPATFPSPPAEVAPALTAARTTRRGRWLDAAAVPYLARRLGGASPVMEAIYANRPVGRTRRGRWLDRIVHLSPAARAVRHRRVVTAAWGRRRRPARLLSVPCGGAGDAAAIGAAQTVLVDPDPAARALARAACPHADVRDGTLETAPEGPFDLALYIGLSEYLDDAAVVAQLRALRDRLAPGGALLASSTADSGQRRLMATWLGWHTRARAPDTFAELLARAGFAIRDRVADPYALQWLFEAEPSGD